MLSVPISILIYIFVCAYIFAKRPTQRTTLGIFIMLSLISQAIGYGFNIRYLKIYTSINSGHGISYNFIVGTVIPLILAFGISYIFKRFKRAGKALR
ncbi:hypothetical protein [Desulfosporosinus sp. FKA]|uniref:Uncharacterized protein n=1 Tax=Desulfosporosinus acididurans TaxID=476652 RepID=A0A0J1FLP0_9FIRM|nr:hypothetical protein [Desulfosporosinus sp. FKA]KLU64444.1 hypothetical protein DEAC_c36460 [Desulfosporosinus acididurans]